MAASGQEDDDYLHSSAYHTISSLSTHFESSLREKG